MGYGVSASSIILSFIYCSPLPPHPNPPLCNSLTCDIAAVTGNAESTGTERHGHATALSVAPDHRWLRLSREFIAFPELASDAVYRGFFVGLYVRYVYSAAIACTRTSGTACTAAYGNTTTIWDWGCRCVTRSGLVGASLWVSPAFWGKNGMGLSFLRCATDSENHFQGTPCDSQGEQTIEVSWSARTKCIDSFTSASICRNSRTLETRSPRR